MSLSRFNAIMKDAWISEKALDSYYEQRDRHREVMLKTMEAAERCPGDPVVQFLQATAADTADIIDKSIKSLELGLAKRPDGGWLAEFDRKREEGES